jgi:hypothetical protein
VKPIEVRSTPLRNHPKSRTTSKKIECSDESFFSTIFKPGLKQQKNSGTTYVKWANSGGPRPILLEDLAREKATMQYLFARKITSRDEDLLNFLSTSSN